ncbi:MAG: hypothetical protein ABI554_07395, partial [Flavobacterium sp.]
MKILFLTDSLSLPRKYDGGEVIYEDTYICKLREKYPEILISDVAIGGAKITDLLVQCFYYKQFKPDLVFIQCGIVDCAPRSFSLLEKVIIDKLRLRKFSKLFEKKLRKIRKGRQGYATEQGVYLGNTLQDIAKFCITSGSAQSSAIEELIEQNP